MTDFQAHRDFVISRLGCPERLLPGEHYRGGTPSSKWGYQRWEQYLDENDYETTTEGIARFVADLEAMRERDFPAFHHGRGMLLGELPVMIEELDDPNPTLALPTTKVQVRSRQQLVATRLREKVLGRLGRPAGIVPGENYWVSDSPGVQAMIELGDHLDLDISERAIDRGIELVAALRARDRPAFCLGRTSLLQAVSIQLELPTRDPI